MELFNVNVDCIAFRWIETKLPKAKEKGAEMIEREGKKITMGVPIKPA